MAEWDRWQAPDRDSPATINFQLDAQLGDQLRLLLRMEGADGLNDTEVQRVTGQSLSRARRWHKIFERMGILYSTGGVTRLTELGRRLRDAGHEGILELRRRAATDVVRVLRKYQLRNPSDQTDDNEYPNGSDIHPYWAIWKAIDELDGRLHWDELNRELMWVLRHDDLPAAIERIRRARTANNYDPAAGGSAELPLRGRAYTQEGAPDGKDPDGQVRDQKTTPWFRRAGFGGLLLTSPGAGGGGYWRISEDLRELIHEAVQVRSEYREFTSAERWFEYYGALSPQMNVSWVTETLVSRLPEVASGLRIDRSLFVTLLTALSHDPTRHFVILRGISGTGKSLLTDVVARAVYGIPRVSPPAYTLVPVRPDWTDSGPLLGAFNPIERRYETPPFLRAVLYALDHPDEPIFICLDEMNLARVEYYLAEVLSAMESGQPIHLERQSDVSVPSEFRWPSNVYLFGTVNIDESTMPITDKVLDRANVVSTDDVELADFVQEIVGSAASIAAADRERLSQALVSLWTELRPVNGHFGYRTAKAIVSFVDRTASDNTAYLSLETAIDHQISQKVLPKLRGDDRWTDVLERLEGLLAPYPRSLAIVQRMRGDLGRFGAFQYWS